ncbi:MAG: hypothetical protein FWG88_06330 [Oscillospiraceae bacterium]|nr:hypothetical protein [Oscillospiraceae bacterium]
MKTKNKTLMRNIVSITLVITLILGILLTPLLASHKVTAAQLKEEVIYVRLNNDGSMRDVYVVNSFTLDENRQIIDYGNYSYVQNLSNMDVLRLRDGIVTIDTSDSILFYEGFLMDAQLPWDFSIIYTLDGLSIDADELGGKSGYLEMEINTKFNEAGNLEFFDRYCLQISVSLDTSICRNIQAPSGTIAAAGGNRQINFIIFPGKEAQLLITTDVDNFEMPSITIAGVTMNMGFDFDDVDFSDLQELIDGLVELDDGVQELLDGIFDLNKGVSELYDGSVEFADGMEEFLDGTGELVDGVGELFDGTEELRDGVIELSDGTLELRDGVRDLKDGVIEMAEGMEDMLDGVEELVDGVREFDDGVSELYDGVDELYDGVKEILDGSEKLYKGFLEILDGAKELSSGMSDFATGAGMASAGGRPLYDGFSAYFDVLLQMANAQLATYATATSFPPLTPDNYATVLTGMVTGPAITAARAQFELSVEAGTRNEILNAILEAYGLTMAAYNALAAPFKAMIDGAVDAQLADPLVQLSMQQAVDDLMAAYMDTIIDQALQNPAAAPLMELYTMLASYEALLGGLSSYNTGIYQISVGAASLSRGVTKFTDGLAEYRDGLKEYTEGMEEFYEGTGELVDGVKKLAEGSRELLDGVIELRDGVIEFRDGVIELRDGVVDLFDGIVELHNGVIELRDGVIELHDGVIKLNDGVSELHDGAREIRDGAVEFRNGIRELYDGTRELYDGVETLKDGTGEIRENTSTLDTDIVDGIKDTVDEMLGSEGPVVSFVSEMNGEISAVQFLMQTEGIKRPAPPSITPPETEETTFFQRFRELFR